MILSKELIQAVSRLIRSIEGYKTRQIFDGSWQMAWEYDGGKICREFDLTNKDLSRLYDFIKDTNYVV